MKKLYTIILLAVIGLSANAQVVNIPDPIFKAYLLADTLINSNKDDSIQVSEATAYAGTINVYSLNISDLTGIQAFTALTELNCGNNNLDSLNVSSNTALTYLDCDDNYLTSLKVSSNTALTYLDCGGNLLTSLNVSANPFLDTLSCSVSIFTNLDVSSNPLLIYLDCISCGLTSLNLNVNTALAHLDCSQNGLDSLNLSSDSALTFLYCDYNNLTSLNIKNGNNFNMPGSNFNAFNNSALLCIDVDSVGYSNANWSNHVDALAGFSTDCSACYVNIPDYNFKAVLLANPAINTNGDGEIQCSEAAAYTGIINVSSFSKRDTAFDIQDLTGIQAFTSVTGLICGNNLLTNLDLSSNTALTYLDCDNNNLTSLNLSSNIALTYLDCDGNKLTSLDVSSDIALDALYCYNNNLTSLNVKNGNNSNMPGTGFDATNNSLLTCIEVDSAAYSIANWDSIDSWANFNTNCNYATPVNEIASVTHASIYPNPATSRLTIYTSSYINEHANIFIKNTLGQVLYQSAINNPQSEIDISLLSAGIYFAEVVGENGRWVGKFVKE